MWCLPNTLVYLIELSQVEKIKGWSTCILSHHSNRPDHPGPFCHFEKDVDFSTEIGVAHLLSTLILSSAGISFQYGESNLHTKPATW